MFAAIINIFAVPFGYVMSFIYGLFHSYGLSIIIFSLLAKAAMTPMTLKQKRSSLSTLKIQPQMQALQKKYKNDKQKYNEEVQKLYAESGVSPMAGCGSTLMTLPIMTGLYYVIAKPLTYFMRLTAAQITDIFARFGLEVSNNFTAEINVAQKIFDNFDKVADIGDNILKVDFHFLGINLAATPDFKTFNLLWIIPILSGLSAMVFSLVQRHMQNKLTETPVQMPGGNLMIFMMPLVSLYFGFILPAGLGLYWITNNLLSIALEYILTWYFKKYKSDELPQATGKKKKDKGVSLQ